MPRSVPRIDKLTPFEEAIRLLDDYGFHVFWRRETDTVGHGKQTQVVADHRRKRLLVVIDSMYKEVGWAFAYGVIHHDFRPNIRPEPTERASRYALVEDLKNLGASYVQQLLNPFQLLVCVDLTRNGLTKLERIHRDWKFVDWKLSESEVPIYLASMEFPAFPGEPPERMRERAWDQLQAAFPRRVRNFVYGKGTA